MSTKVPAFRISFFARIRKAELSCPCCGTFHTLTRGKNGWDPRTSRFECTDCRTSFDLGVVAWPTSTGPVVIPPDINRPLRPKQESPVVAGLSHSMLMQNIKRTKVDPVNLNIASLDPKLEKLFQEADERGEEPWQGSKPPLSD